MPELSRSEQMRQLLESIRTEYTYCSRFTGLPAPDQRIMDALAEVPREEFVPADLRRTAYINRPLPIGDGQTISQPFIVALMTDLLEPEEEDVILEVGTGSGYQSAVLSRLVKQVYSVEIIPALARAAAQRLFRLGYLNVEVRAGDGNQGWPEHAPYDGIIVTAGAIAVPPLLIGQLKPRSRLVIPVREGLSGQVLMLVEKDPDGRVITREILPVAFVPLTGGSIKAR